MELERVLIKSGEYQTCIRVMSVSGVINNTHWIIKKKTDSRILYKCAHENCNCRAEVISKIINGDITWEAYQIGTHTNHTQNLAKPLKEHLIMAISKASYENKSIQESIISDVKMKVSNQTINRIKRTKYILNIWESMWKKLPDFVNLLNKDQILSHIWIENEDNIKSVFLTFPYVDIFCKSDAFLNIIFVDGTFCTDHNHSTLLAAVTVTADKVILPIGVAITNGETNENYTYFLEQLSKYVLDSPELTFLSDRHPAIISSISKVYPLSKSIPCAWHVLQHIRCPKVVFFELIKTDNVKLYNARKAAFIAKYPKSADKIYDLIDKMSYIGNNNVKMGYISDSPIESFNNSIKEYRDKEPLLILYKVFQWSISQREKQLKLLNINNIYCNTAIYKKNSKKEMSTFLTVVKQKDNTYIVIEFARGNLEVWYIVKEFLDSIICDCNGYERDGIPCRHEHAVAERFGLIYKLRKIAKFNETKVIKFALGESYECPNIGNLIEHNVMLPNIKRGPGRPKTLRYRSIDEYIVKKSPRRVCSICKKPGHNKRSCPLNANTRIHLYSNLDEYDSLVSNNINNNMNATN